MKNTKTYLLITLVLVLTVTLPIISNWANDIVLVDNLSAVYNKQIVYQSITLLGTIGLLFVLRLARKQIFAAYFRKGNISATVIPVPIIGIKPKPHENWWHTGRDFSIVVSIVTAIVIYFQVIKGNAISVIEVLKVLPLSIAFALINSFVEESITRLGVVVALKGILNDKIIALISAMIFGIVHYWGSPGGIVGVFVAGFLGWLMAKSILETKGIFWAWFIHFLQDVIIFTALFAVA